MKDHQLYYGTNWWNFSNNREISKQNLEFLKKYESFLDRLGIYLDFSKSDKIRIFQEIKNYKEYFILFTIILNPVGLFNLRISEIFPIIDSEQIETDIEKHLKNIANKNSIE